MKNIIRILLLLSVLGTLFAKYHIVIVAGQSNCLNIHTRATVLPSSASDSLVPFFYDLYYPPGFAPNDLVCTSDDQWETLKVQQGDEAITTSYAFFGPEMTMARTLSQHLDSVAVFKFGIAGSTLAKDWEMSEDGARQGFIEFIQKIRAAEAAMINDGQTFEWTAMTWMQGESDAANQTRASSYYRNLGYLMKQVRDSLAVPDLPFVIGLLADELRLDSFPYRETVLDAQRRRADADEHALVVNTADFEMDTDNVHFNSNGVMDLGVGFANAILELTTETAIITEEHDLDGELRLLPNPVNGNLLIEYELEPTVRVELDIYDVLGHRLKQMRVSNLAGSRQLILPVHDLNSGIYLAVLRADGQTLVNKFSVVK